MTGRIVLSMKEAIILEYASLSYIGCRLHEKGAKAACLISRITKET